jgi:hypothetical protein
MSQKVLTTVSKMLMVLIREAVETLSYGLIAEEVEAVNPELCYYDEVDGT